MSLTPDQLPDDIAELKRRLIVQSAELVAAKSGLLVSTLEVEKLKAQIGRLRRQSFGAASERIAREIEQLELRLEEAEATQAEAAAAMPATANDTPPQSPDRPGKKPRRQLPADLPRRTELHEPPRSCDCDAVQRKVGEDVTEILEYIPGRFEVVRHVRPATSCRICGTMAQAPMPALPIPRGQAGPGLLAHVAIAKYCDHIPLYRQAEIFARDGVDLDRAMLADWIGRMAWLLKPLAERIGAHVMAGRAIHADDTPVPVLAPGKGKTRTGRIWVYLRDERPHAGDAMPAVLYRYAPDRKGERCRAHLAAFRGFLHADGYAGFSELYAGAGVGPPCVVEVGCWAHARRKFFDVHQANGSAIAREALERIGVLFDIERGIAGLAPERRTAIRQSKAKPQFDALAAWLDAQLQRIPGKGELAGAIRYARSRWQALTRYCDEGRLEISNNAVENAIRPIALGRKNWLFAGSDNGGERAAIFYAIIRTAKLNGIEPEAYLRDLFTRIGEHPINRIDELLPWNTAQSVMRAAA
jgi:transposase